MPILDSPASVLGKCQDITLGVEEEEGLGGTDRQARVCALAAAGNLVADLVLQNLIRLHVALAKCPKEREEE